ncbi:MAG TPA: hypothetical protein VIT21_04700 [Chthoniobacterales bacterium]
MSATVLIHRCPARARQHSTARTTDDYEDEEETTLPKLDFGNMG